MIELKVAKTAWLSSARVEFLKGGMHDGALAVALSFTGRPVSPSEATDLLSSLLSLSLPRNRLLRFSGAFPENDDNLVVLVQALQRYGFKILVVSNNDQLASWMDGVDWLTIRTATPLLMVQPSEVWYSPAGEKWDDITMPINPNKMTLFYFDRTKGIEETEKFFCTSQHHWQLV